MRHFRHLLFHTLSVSLIAGGCTLLGDEQCPMPVHGQSDYFPLKEGNSWLFDYDDKSSSHTGSSAQVSKMTLTVGKAECEDGRWSYELHEHITNDRIQYKKRVVQISQGVNGLLLGVDSDSSVYRYEFTKADTVEIRFPALRNDFMKWKCFNGDAVLKLTRDVGPVYYHTECTGPFAIHIDRTMTLVSSSIQ